MENKVYPNSVPEFRMLKKLDGTMEMQVRYLNKALNYTGKWMPVNIVEEEIDKTINGN
jgi:hypothetical protein